MKALLYGFTICLIGGCGTLPRMVPLDRDLSEEELSYAKSLRSESSYHGEMEILGRRFPTDSGDFHAALVFPLYASGQAVGSGQSGGCEPRSRRERTYRNTRPALSFETHCQQ